MRRRLVLVTAAVTTMVVLAFLIPLAILVRDLARDRVLSAAERDAQTIARLISTLSPDGDPTGVARAVAGSGSLEGQAISVILPDGTVIGAPILDEEDLSAALAGRSLRAVYDDGEVIYVPVVLSTGETTVVRVLVTKEELSRNVASAWVTLAALGVFLVGLSVLVADRLGRSVVGPVTELSAAAGRLASGDLAARVRPAGPPEIEQLGQVFNRLATRIRVLIQQERETAADLSHRLRTPLTAARLDAERLRPSPERDRLMEDLDDLERMVDHIIREARRPARTDAGDVTDVAAVAAERAEFWKPLAEEQDRRTDFVQDPHARGFVAVPRDDIEAAIDALIGNVFAHTPEGTAFRIEVRGGDREVVVTVADEGPGFGEASPVTRGESGSGSTGLGLDIARRTAESVGGELRVGNGPRGGAIVTLRLPTVEP